MFHILEQDCIKHNEEVFTPQKLIRNFIMEKYVLQHY